MAQFGLLGIFQKQLIYNEKNVPCLLLCLLIENGHKVGKKKEALLYDAQCGYTWLQ